MANTITIADRLVSVEMDRPAVGGNSYSFGITADAEWTGNVFVRVRFGSLYYDIPIDLDEDDSVSIQFPINFPEAGIGVYSEALEICTNETRVKLLKSILTSGEEIVEFDDNLYSAWESAMTEYLTDDSFDAESTRPVQNAVITAWKDTVAVDSEVVHKAGDELITGIKTFFANPIIENFSLAELLIKSDAASYIAGKKGRIVFNIGSTEAGEIALETALSQNKLTIKEGTAEIGLITDTAAGKSYATAPVADASLTDEGIIVTKGSLATEPSVVHTSGNETIAGTKTLTSNPTVQRSAPTLLLRDTSSGAQAQGVENWASYLAEQSRKVGEIKTVLDAETSSRPARTRTKVAVYAPAGSESGSANIEINVLNNGTAYVTGPTYLDDNNADIKLVNRAMLAVSPFVVHTTGNEDIAGVKEFSNGINGYPTDWHKCAGSNMNIGDYAIFAKITGMDNGRFHYFEFIQSSNTMPAWGRMVFRANKTNPYAIWVFRTKYSGTGHTPLTATSVVVLSDGTDLYLAWKKEYQYGGLMCRECLDTLNGETRSRKQSAVEFYAAASMTITSDLSGYTVFQVEDS